MAEKEFAYAVARIRCKEMTLLDSAFLEQLVGAKDEDDCLRLLVEKGWESAPAEEMLDAEEEKTWALIRELVPDQPELFDALLYEADFHNAKAAVKAVCMNADPARLFLPRGTADAMELYRAVKEREWDALPEHLREAAHEAFDTLLHTQDGQLCDVILDRAALDAILAAAKRSGSDLLESWAERKVAAADMKTAVRCARTGKPLSFARRALAPCATLDVDALAQAAAEGEEELTAYLAGTPYAETAKALEESFSTFERRCDNLLIEEIRPQKYNPFTVSPLAAYVLARENEIRCVRVILSGKRNGLSEQSIREKVRETYV